MSKFSHVSQRRAWIAAASISLVTAVSAGTASAATYDLFLIADHTAPDSDGSITTQTAYQIDLATNNGAIGISEVDNFDFNIGSSLSLDNFVYPVTSDPARQSDPGEGDTGTVGYIGGQMATWDTVNVPGTDSYVPTDQYDYGRNATTTFDGLKGGMTDLIIAEVGGVNPFEVWLCEDAACSTRESLFIGISTSIFGDIYAAGTGLQISDDGSAVDQTWLFRFTDPVEGFVQVIENDSRSTYTNRRLGIDYIGAVGVTQEPPAPPSEVPGPASLPLMAGGLALLALMRRRRNA